MLFGVNTMSGLRQWRRACREAELRRYLMHGLILIMAVGDLFNSLILDNMEGHFYILIAVALSGGWSRPEAPEPAG